MKKQENGITLIALVITIIVMLILTGVTISLLLDDDGIISKATEVGKVQAKAEMKEKLELFNASLKMEEISPTSNSNVFSGGNDGDDGGLTEYLINNGVLITEDALIIENGDKTINFDLCVVGVEEFGVEGVYDYIFNIPCEDESGNEYYVKAIINVNEADGGKFIVKEVEMAEGIEEIIGIIGNDIRKNPDNYLTGATSSDDRDSATLKKIYSVYADNDLVLDAEYVNAEGTGLNLEKLAENAEISGYSYIFTIPCSKDGERVVTKIVMTAGNNYQDSITAFWVV